VKVRLHRKPEVGRLNPVSLADALDLRRHLSLVFERKKVFDNGITEDNIEAAVIKLTEISGVSHRWLYILKSLRLRLEINGHDLDITTSGPTALFPESIRSPDVKDLDRSRQLSDILLKQLESAIAKLVRQRVGTLVVGEPTDQRN
jgi:hypothetical protein